MGWISRSDLDPALAKALENVRPGSWSGKLVMNNTIARVYVAETRQAMPSQLEGYRERVMSNIFGNRVELEARRFMQNLRQRAFLDVRL